MERKTNRQVIGAIFLLALVYVVGILGLLHHSTTLLFQKLVPFNILFSAAVLMHFHRVWNGRVVITFISVMLAGFFLEVIGVHTGRIFGSYEYGNSLGLKIFQTPLIIGLNWLLLIYITHVATLQMGIRKPWIELTAAAIMTALDYLIEPVAVKFDFWQWQDAIIPVQNFAAWFYISFFMQLFFNYLKPVIKNPLAIPLLIFQILFFVILNAW